MCEFICEFTGFDNTSYKHVFTIIHKHVFMLKSARPKMFVASNVNEDTDTAKYTP